MSPLASHAIAAILLVAPELTTTLIGIALFAPVACTKRSPVQLTRPSPVTLTR